ncbi:MAG: DNA cytosine methyltransferase, partial [Microcystaceae cyanobacterium]
DKKVNFDPQKLDNSSVKTSSTQTTVFEAISDLEAIPAMTGTDQGIAAQSLSYVNHRQKYAMVPSDAFQFCHHRFHRGIVYGHLGSLHTQDSRARFAITEPGTIEPKSRFWKLSADGFCNTLRAGTNRDKGAYTAPRPIHYALPRCITIREAARLHTFPDWFQFHRTIWHGFREIGNAVIPVLAKELGSSILKFLEIDPKKLPRSELKPVEESILTYNLSQASAYWEISDNIIPKRKRPIKKESIS